MKKEKIVLGDNGLPIAHPVTCSWCGKASPGQWCAAACQSCVFRLTETPLREKDAAKAIERPARAVSDLVNHPAHYTGHPSGVECIEVTEHMGFCLGNVIKYVWRTREKGAVLEDLKKARWYLDREISKLEKESGKP